MKGTIAPTVSEPTGNTYRALAVALVVVAELYAAGLTIARRRLPCAELRPRRPRERCRNELFIPPLRT
jgi:hypothetical protein